MTDATLGFPEAARRLGVSLRVLRHAIRTGRIAAPPQVTATASLPADWLKSVEAAVAKTPQALSRSFHQKVAPFARYEGTSAWRKYGNRVHAYARFRAAAEQHAG
jgi:predicted site-specific integrase-resolvase